MFEKVLVADDDSLMLRFIVETLRRRGIEALAAKDGAEAIRILETEPIDLILSDVKMPLKTGPEVLAAAKKLHPNCIAILMTAHGTIEAAPFERKQGQ